MKKIVKQGFTLIELMIVIVILGVLMSTILPRLTGAQARARDAGRVADLGNISAALQVYYDDNGQFPAADSSTAGAKSNGECLGADLTKGAANAVKGYLKSTQVPLDPSKGANGGLCPTAVSGRTGFYWYKPLTRSGVANNAYVLCSDAETFQKANTVLTTGNGFTTAYDPAGTSYETAAPQIGPSGQSLTADSATATDSLYCILN